MIDTLRIFEPSPGVLAYYDGRKPGHRYLPQENWVDDGAIGLGVASYAVVSGAEALVYDTHVSLAHARAVRDDLTARGVTRFTVVLSHWHLDHVAGTEVFADCPILSNARTLEHLTRHRAAIEDGRHHGAPAIAPLILPNRTFSGEMTLTIGTREVRLIQANIHSDDATVLFLPDAGLLLAGDTVEDCVTYVAAPEDLALHLQDLARLARLAPTRILPCHGDPDIIAQGGYGPELIGATQRYVGWLLGLPGDPARAAQPLSQVIAEDLSAGTLRYFAPYEAVHTRNIYRVQAL